MKKGCLITIITETIHLSEKNNLANVYRSKI